MTPRPVGAPDRLGREPWPAEAKSPALPYRVYRLNATAVLVFALLGSLFSHPAFATDPSERRNVVVDFLYQADTQWETEAQEAVVREAFDNMLNVPVEKLRAKRYPDWNLRPNQWSITALLEHDFVTRWEEEYHHFVPTSPQRKLEDASFFRDVKAPEAQRVIRVWANWLNGPANARKRLPEWRPWRNVVADYLNGADGQWETDDQGAVLKQALTDMLDEPVEKLRAKKYPDYQMRPQQWSVIELLQAYVLSRSLQDAYPDETVFFREVKEPEARKAIRAWLDRFKAQEEPPPKLRPRQARGHGR